MVLPHLVQNNTYTFYGTPGNMMQKDPWHGAYTVLKVRPCSTITLFNIAVTSGELFNGGAAGRWDSWECRGAPYRGVTDWDDGEGRHAM